MLVSLKIEQFTIVAQLELDFNMGMSAFTGETGAGKSILIDALLLAMGGRAEASVVRPGAEKCDITACFQVDASSEARAWLATHDVDESDELIILRRVIYAEGRSKSYVNGQLFPLQKVRELSASLVDIHGQHQHQSLLHHATHRQQLDQFAHADELLAAVQSCYQDYQNIQQALSAIKAQHPSEERKELLRYQIDELEALHIEENEMRLLHDEHQMLHHAHDYLMHSQQLAALLSANDEGGSVYHQLHQAQLWLDNLPAHHPAIHNAKELLNSASIHCEEAYDEISRFADEIQLDPERLNWVEERLSKLHQVARKHQIDSSQLLNHLHYLQQQWQQLQQYSEQETLLQQQLTEKKAQYQQKALALRQLRQQAAPLLAKEINQTIRQLGMPHGAIHIGITPLDTMHTHGLDKVEYSVCTNAGMKPDSLAKIASGGELSRISLAIELSTAKKAATPTLFFDEVDVGIGGATAALVGQLLRRLGERLQVFCVTHQPQVASAAHHHFFVEKFTEKQQTFSRIIALTKAQKVDEIARMLGGLTVTPQTRNHAEELLANSATEVPV